MASESYEFSGKTVDDAIAEGLQSLKLRIDEVEIEVLNKGSRGIFGLGSEPALVRIQLLRPASEPTAAPKAIPPTSAPSNAAAASPDEPSAAPSLPIQAQEAGLPDAAATGEDLEDDDLQDDDLQDEELDDAPPDDQDVAAIAQDLLLQTVKLMGFNASVQASWKENTDELSEQRERYLLLDVQGVELSPLIGRRGETLESLQYLLRLMVNQSLRRWENVVVDVEGYKERRVLQLQQLAERTAAQVASTGRAVALEPMPPNERRIVHITLREHPDVYTESMGEGERRKVQIVAKA